MGQADDFAADGIRALRLDPVVQTAELLQEVCADPFDSMEDHCENDAGEVRR